MLFLVCGFGFIVAAAIWDFITEIKHLKSVTG